MQWQVKNVEFLNETNPDEYGWPGGKYLVFTQQIHQKFCEQIWLEHLRKSKWWPRSLKNHQLHPTTRPEQTRHKSSPDKKKMAELNPDKSLSEEKPAAGMEATTLSSFGNAACCHQGLAR